MQKLKKLFVSKNLPVALALAVGVAYMVPSVVYAEETVSENSIIENEGEEISDETSTSGEEGEDNSTKEDGEGDETGEGKDGEENPDGEPGQDDKDKEDTDDKTGGEDGDETGKDTEEGKGTDEENEGSEEEGTEGEEKKDTSDTVSGNDLNKDDAEDTEEKDDEEEQAEEKEIKTIDFDDDETYQDADTEQEVDGCVVKVTGRIPVGSEVIVEKSQNDEANEMFSWAVDIRVELDDEIVDEALVKLDVVMEGLPDGFGEEEVVLKKLDPAGELSDVATVQAGNVEFEIHDGERFKELVESMSASAEGEAEDVEEKSEGTDKEALPAEGTEAVQ